MKSFIDVIMSGKPTLVDFFATWCQPCKMMHPVLEQVKATLGDRIRIIKVDVDQHQQIAAAYQIQSVPTLTLFQNGEILYRQSGAMLRNEVLALLDPFMNK